jgi:hypothetical protein
VSAQRSGGRSASARRPLTRRRTSRAITGIRHRGPCVLFAADRTPPAGLNALIFDVRRCPAAGSPIKSPFVRQSSRMWREFRLSQPFGPPAEITRAEFRRALQGDKLSTLLNGLGSVPVYVECAPDSKSTSAS